MKLPLLSRVKRLFILILPALTIFIILGLLREQIPEPVYFSLPDNTDKTTEYPTNKTELEKEGYLINQNTGIAYKLPEGYELKEGFSYPVLEGKENTLVILSDCEKYYTDPMEVFRSFKGDKETLKFSLAGKTYNTTLFDFTGGLEKYDLNGRSALMEEEEIYVNGGEKLSSAYLNFCLSGRAVAVGIISKGESDFESLRAFTENIRDISYIGSLNPKDLSVNKKIVLDNLTLYVPESFREERINSKTIVFRPEVSSGDIFYGSRIILYKNEENKSVFSLPDSIYQNEDLKKAFGNPGKINTKVINDRTRNSDRIGLSEIEEDLTLSPKNLTTRSEIKYKAFHLIKEMDSGESVHIILSGIDGVSYDPLKEQAEKITREVN